mgnify:CR=1 FL=1
MNQQLTRQQSKDMVAAACDIGREQGVNLLADGRGRDRVGRWLPVHVYVIDHSTRVVPERSETPDGIDHGVQIEVRLVAALVQGTRVRLRDSQPLSNRPRGCSIQHLLSYWSQVWNPAREQERCARERVGGCERAAAIVVRINP